MLILTHLTFEGSIRDQSSGRLSGHSQCAVGPQLGYSCVLNATHLFPKLKGKNPPGSPDGHALITPSGQAVWMKIVNGISVVDMANIRAIRPDEIPVGDGEIRYRSAAAERKLRVEHEARELSRNGSERLRVGAGPHAR